MSDKEEKSSGVNDDPLPPGVPDPPDPAKIHDLREQMEEDQASRGGFRRVLNRDQGQQARDIGTYTLIPMMMIAGPIVGYLLGKGLEKVIGGEPWPAVIGMLFGVVAAFRQVFLMLAKKGKKK